MTKTIAIANQKGGVGKTCTTVNLGVRLADYGYRVLLVDLDAQANLTMSLGWHSPDELSVTVATMLHKTINEESIASREGILTHQEGIDLLPSSIQLSGFDATLNNELGRESVLRQYLHGIEDQYDFILIDCMPSLNVLTVNALVAANSVIVPTQPQYFSMAGLQMLFQTIQRVQRKLNPALQVEGVLVTMMDRRPLFTRDLVSKLRENYGEHIRVFEAEIPTSIRLVESGAKGKSIFAYDPNGKAADAYDMVAREVMNHERSRNREGRSVYAVR